MFDSVSLRLIAWSVLGLLGTVGLVAVANPRWFRSLASMSNTWVDSDRMLQALNRRVEVDHLILPFSRALGVAVLVATGCLCYLLWTVTG